MTNEKPKRYALGYCITAKDFYHHFPLRKVFPEYLPWIHDGDNELMKLGKVFTYFMYLVLMDIIENNITFKFPEKTHAYLEMNHLTKDEFIKARQRGAFHDVDYLLSDFTANRLQLRYSTRYGKWTKRIYVGNNMKKLILDYTHQRKHYG